MASSIWRCHACIGFDRRSDRRVVFARFFFVGGAPQQAALAATACAFCIVPYVGFRVSQLEDAALQKKVFFEQMQKRMEELIEAHKPPQ